MNSKIIQSNKHWVYALRNPMNNVIVYIGITQNPKRRKRDHLGTMKCKCKEFKQLIIDLKSLGMNLGFELIHEYDNFEIAHSMEVVLINALNPIFNYSSNKIHNDRR